MNGVTPEQIGIFVLIALNLLPSIKSIKELFQPTQKREVSFADKFATTQQLKEVEHDLSGRISNVDRDVKALKESIVVNGEKRRIAIEAKVEDSRKEARARGDELQNSVVGVSVQVGKTEKAIEGLSTTVMLLNDKLDRVITNRRLGV